jgi:hypothetical protein
MNMIYKAIDWITESTLRTGAGLSVLFIFGVVAASASQTTSWDVTNNPQMYLDASITASQTENIKLSALQRNGETVIFPNSTGGVLRIRQGTRVEDISFTGATVNATTKVVTLAGVTRNICWNITDRLVSCGNGYSFSKGAITELSIDARLLNFKANKDRANTFTASGAVTFSGSGSFAFPTFATTAARDQALGATPGGPVRGACAIDTGLCYLYTGGAWTAIGDAGTANATTTVSGKGELATSSDILSALGFGDSGPLVIPASLVARSSSGTTQANKIPALDSTGYLSGSLLGSGTPSSTTFLRGDQTWGTPSIGGVYCDGTDGEVTLLANTTLTRDTCYSTLRLNGFTLSMNGYRVYVSVLLTGSGKLAAPSGGAGGNGAAGATGNPGLGGAGGTPGVAARGGSLPAGNAGIAGGKGGNGTAGGPPSDPATGSASLVINSITNIAGIKGGSGGNAVGLSTYIGAISSGGTIQFGGRNTYPFLNAWAGNSGSTLLPLNGSARSGGGGGGAGAGCSFQPNPGGGGGGASGASGGYWLVAAKNIAGTFTIESLGGAGGNGGAGTTASSCYSGGGGGGTGGPGGSGVLFYNNKSSWSGTFVLTGGAGGTGGLSGGGSATNGYNGLTGGLGTAIQLQI